MNRKLFEARRRKSLSIADAAAAVGTVERTYQRWEHGESFPQPYFRRKLCDFYGASLDELGLDKEASTDRAQQDDVSDAMSPTPKGTILTLTAQEVQDIYQILGLGEDEMKQFDISKRETLEKLARAAKIAAGVAVGDQVLNPEPWEQLARATEKPSVLSLASLEKFKTLLADCWELSNNKELEVAEVILSSFLPKITATPSREVTADIAYVASQGLRLQSVLIHHRLQLADKVRMCEQSVEYGRHANDVNTLVETLVELAVAYKYNGQPDQWFKTLQEALYYVPQASPLVQSQTYLKSSLAFAHYKRLREADLYFQLGSDVFPNRPEHDPGYALADASIYTFSRDAGRAQLEIGRVAEAYSAFGIYTSSSLLIPERLRLEIVNAQCRAAILEEDLDKYAHFLKDGLAGALELGSKKRFDEAYTTFREDMPAAWLKDSEIRSIGEQYHLVRS